MYGIRTIWTHCQLVKENILSSQYAALLGPVNCSAQLLFVGRNGIIALTRALSQILTTHTYAMGHNVDDIIVLPHVCASCPI